MSDDIAHEYFEKGKRHIEAGRFPEAIECFDRAIQLRPDYAEAYYNRGKTKKKLGDDSGANDDFKKSHKLDPSLIFPVPDSQSTKEGRQAGEGIEKTKGLRPPSLFQRLLEEAREGYGWLYLIWVGALLFITLLYVFYWQL